MRAMRFELPAKAIREAVQSRFNGSVSGGPGGRYQCESGSDEDDRFRFRPAGQDFAGELNRCGEVEMYFLIQIARGRSGGSEVSLDESPGVVDQNVEAPKPLRNRIQHYRSLRVVGHVGLYRKDFRVFETYAVKGKLGSSANDHSVAATKKSLRESETDTGAAAGNEDDSLCDDYVSP